jgi:hypothetical protein
VDLLEECLQIEIIVSGSADRDQPDPVPGEDLDDVLLDSVVDENTNDLKTLGQRGGFRRQMALEIGDLEPEIPVRIIERFNVVGFRIKERDLDGIKGFSFHEEPSFS